MDIRELRFKRRWYFRLEAPQRLLRFLSGTLKDLGYTTQEIEPVKYEELTASDVVTFTGEIVGKKWALHMSRRYAVIEVASISIALILLVISLNWVMIVAAIIMVLLATILLLTTSQPYTRVLIACLEGRAHKDMLSAKIGNETIETVGDTYLELAGGVTDKYDNLIESSLEQKILKKDFATLIQKVEIRLPSFVAK